MSSIRSNGSVLGKYRFTGFPLWFTRIFSKFHEMSLLLIGAQRIWVAAWLTIPPGRGQRDWKWMERKCKHPRPQSCDRFSQRYGLRALWIWNLDFRLAAEPQKSQTITLPTITRLKLLRLRAILELAWALNPCCWPNEPQLWLGTRM